jgi:hypothetical protein
MQSGSCEQAFDVPRAMAVAAMQFEPVAGGRRPLRRPSSVKISSPRGRSRSGGARRPLQRAEIDQRVGGDDDVECFRAPRRCSVSSPARARRRLLLLRSSSMPGGKIDPRQSARVRGKIGPQRPVPQPASSTSRFFEGCSPDPRASPRRAPGAVGEARELRLEACREAVEDSATKPSEAAAEHRGPCRPRACARDRIGRVLGEPLSKIFTAWSISPIVQCAIARQSPGFAVLRA